MGEGRYADPGYVYDGPPAPGDEARTPQQIQDAIRHTPTAPPSGAGGYRCSLGDLRAAIAQVDRMLTAAHDDLRQVDALVGAEAPARDAEGSLVFTSGLRARGGGVGDLIRSQIADLDAYRGYLAAIADEYGNAEDGHRVSFRDIHRAM